MFVTGLESSGGAEEAMHLLYSHFIHAQSPNWAATFVVLLKNKTSANHREDSPGTPLRLQKKRTLLAIPSLVLLFRRTPKAVVISSLPHVSAAVSLAIWFSGSRCKHIVRIERSLEWESREKISPLRRLKQRATRLWLARAHHYVSVSRELVAESAQFLGKSETCFTHIPNPIFSHDVSRIPVKLSGPGQWPIRLLSVGRLAPEKNLSLAIEVLKNLSSRVPNFFELHIYGEGEERQTLEKAAQLSDVTLAVFFHGRVASKEQIFTAGHILLITSVQEGNPLVMAEALAYGLPVVSVDCNYGPREVITEEWMGAVCSYSPENLAQAVLKQVATLGDQDLAALRSDFAQQNFSLSRIGTMHRQVIEKLLSGEERS